MAVVLLVSSVLLGACSFSRQEAPVPWGEDSDSLHADAEGFDLSNIVDGGELIMVTVSGPETYYDYHGRHLGLEYMMAERFAQQQGVSLRVEVCADTAEMVSKVVNEEADLIGVQLPDSIAEQASLTTCGARTDSLHVGWAVRSDSRQLSAALDAWYTPDLRKKVRAEESFLLSARSIRRHVFSPMLNRKGGVISHYDGYFIAYSRSIGWDWRLMAAQCYQESTFDPHARSWAGARGLMQIMPGTAAHLGLPIASVEDPEQNIAASSRYLDELSGKFRDIPSRLERMKYVLACYNGGYNHVRDAMALTRKNGRNPYSWDEVSHYVLLLSNPAYYRDPVVRYGYMRGSETVGYVSRILERWNQYCSVTHGFRVGIPPQKAKHRNKYR